MDWAAINFDWNQVRAFLVTVHEGSYSAAARVMGLSQPTLSRQVAALEKSLNIVLFEKSGRGLIITPVGRELLVHAEHMGEAAVDFSLAVTGNDNSLSGSVCVSASEIMAGFALPGLVMQMQAAYPAIRLEILASNDASDLRRREADIAIRHFRPTELDLIVKKLRVQYWGLYASTEFHEKHGPFDNKQKIENAFFVGYDQDETLTQHLATHNVVISKNNINVVSRNFLVAMQLVKNGTGLGVLPVDIADKQSDLVRVGADYVQLEVENWLVTHSELRTNQRISAVYDFLAKALGDFN